jgi:glyoxylate reductase
VKVLITQEIDDAGMAILRETDLILKCRSNEAPIPREELLRDLVGCDGLICMPTDRVDREAMLAGPLRVVANHAVGTDNIDFEAAHVLGVTVTNTPGVLTEATADLAMALLLASARRIVEGDRLVRQGKFLGWRPTMLRGADLFGARLGIVGRGRIGSAVAQRAEAFGMEVVSCGRGRGMPLNELLSTSDFISLHCPLTADTRHLIGASELKLMKPSATLINTARGPVVDEQALAVALRENWIAGAGLDVFEEEPVVHPELIGLQNVVLVPHLGSATWGARRKMAVMAAKNLVAVLSGQPPLNPVG